MGASAGCSYQAGSHRVVCAVSSLAAHTATPVTVRVTVKRPLPDGTLVTNGAVGTSAQLDPNLLNNAAQVVSVVEFAPALSLLLLDRPDPVQPGAPLTYTLRYTNTGNANATNVVIAVALDPRLTYGIASPAPSGIVGDVLFWNFSSVAGGGGSGQIRINTVVDAPLPDGTLLTTSAQLTDNEGNSVQRTATTLITGGTLPDLTITASHQPLLFSPGLTMTYAITYSNIGAAPAPSVVITATLPPSTTFGRQDGLRLAGKSTRGPSATFP